MPYYGRRRTYRRSTRRYGRTRRKAGPVRKYKRRQARRSRAVRGYPKQLQTAGRLPKSRVVLFKDTRTFHVNDSEIDAEARPLPIHKQLCLNDPHHMWSEGGKNQGTWTATDYGAKDDQMPGIKDWITNSDGTGNGKYRAASCLGAKVTVSAVYVQETDVDPTVHQAVSKLIVQKQTQSQDAPTGMPMGTHLNADFVCTQPYTKQATLYQNRAGVPKGGTITTNYSYKRMNALLGRANGNTFFANLAPAEKDWLSIWIMPTNTSFSTSGERCGRFRVEISVEAIVKLSEPNTTITQTEGNGSILQSVVRSAEELHGMYTGDGGD